MGSKQIIWYAGVLDEKASASQVLGGYAEHTGPLFAPHIEDTLNMLLKMGNYFHCQVREQAYIALPLLFTATVQAFPAQPSGIHSGPASSQYRIMHWPCTCLAPINWLDQVHCLTCEVHREVSNSQQ